MRSRAACEFGDFISRDHSLLAGVRQQPDVVDESIVDKHVALARVLQERSISDELYDAIWRVPAELNQWCCLLG
jgi:hypothetical protein